MSYGPSFFNYNSAKLLLAMILDLDFLVNGKGLLVWAFVGRAGG